MADVEDVDMILSKFTSMGRTRQDLLLKKILLKCKPRQLQMLYNDTRQLLAVDFVTFVPRELVDRIFSYLTAEELSRAACCSSQWRERTNSDNLWKLLCRRNEWLHFGESATHTQQLFSATPATLVPQTSLTSPTFHPVPSGFKEFPPLCKWKDIYIRANHLHSNWTNGRYIVMPPMRGHKDRINCIDCVGNKLASGSEDKYAVLWDITNGEIIHVFNQHTDAVTCLKIQNNLLLTGCSDGILRVFNISTGKCLGHLFVENEVKSPIRFLQYDGTKAVVGHDDKSVRIWNVKTGNCLYTMNEHTDELVSLETFKKYTVTTSWDETIRVWDMESGRCIHTLRGHTEVVHCCKINDHYIVSGSGDKVVKIWQMASGDCSHTLVGHTDDVYCVDFNEEVITSGAADSTIRIWNWLGVCNHVLREHIGVVRCLKLHQDMLVSSGDQKKIIVWDFKNGKMLNAVHRNPSLVHLMVVNDTKLIAVSPESPGVVTVLSYW